MDWLFLVLVYLPSPLWARYYYSFLRERSGEKRPWSRTCSEHDLDMSCCFGKAGNWQPWPDYLCATIAIMVSFFWPIIALIFFVMSNPKKTSFEIREEKAEAERRIKALEAENDKLRVDSTIDKFVDERETEKSRRKIDKQYRDLRRSSRYRDGEDDPTQW